MLIPLMCLQFVFADVSLVTVMITSWSPAVILPSLRLVLPSVALHILLVGEGPATTIERAVERLSIGSSMTDGGGRDRGAKQ